MRQLLYVTSLLVAVSIVVEIDRAGRSDDSGQVSLLVLLVACACLGFAFPKWAWPAGLVVGGSLAASNAISATWGPAPAHPIDPPGLLGAATLLVLVVPALVAAFIGATAARELSTRGRSATGREVPPGRC